MKTQLQMYIHHKKQQLFAVLKALPSLKGLTISVEKNDDVKEILANLPSLVVLNNKIITEEDRMADKLESSEPAPNNEEQPQEKESDKDSVKENVEQELQLPDSVPEDKEAQTDIEATLLAFENLKRLRETQKLPDTESLSAILKMVENNKSLNSFDEIPVNIELQMLSMLDNDFGSYLADRNKELVNIISVQSKIIQNLLTKSIDNENNQQLLSENESLHNRISQLEEENKSYLHQIIKHSKDAAKKELGSSMPPASANIPSPKYAKSMNSGQLKKISTVKPLSLNQLKELFEDVYNQKKKYDEKCYETKQPKETMEQYIYTYLNQKYGLKTLIVEWASAIINGIKAFSAIDADVALFGKILKNNCDEEFRIIQSQVKSAMIEILKDKLKKKYRTKGEGEISTMITDIQNSEVEEWAWMEIVQKMYNEEHANALILKIKYFIEEKRQQDAKFAQKHLSREEFMKIQRSKEQLNINYNDLQKVQF